METTKAGRRVPFGLGGNRAQSARATATFRERLGERAWSYGWLIGFALALNAAFLLFLTTPGLNPNKRATVVQMIDGTAHRPFVNRALLPICVRTVLVVTPAHWRAGIVGAAQNNSAGRSLFAQLKWEPERADVYLVLCALMYLSLAGFALAVGYLLRAVYEIPPRYVDVITLLVPVILPAFFSYANYLYDFSGLFLFTLCLALMVRRRWGTYLAVYLLACINKETAILLPFIFALFCYRSGERGAFVRLLSAQVVIFGAVKAALFLAYGRNPGGDLEFHLFDHNLPLLASPQFSSLFACLMFVVFCGYRWVEKPPFARTALLILPVLVLLTVFLGYLDEYRDYYEAFPVVVLLLAHSAAQLLGIRLETRPEAVSGGIAPAALAPTAA